MQWFKRKNGVVLVFNKGYVKIIEDEIVGDYFFLVYYKNFKDEVDEFIVVDDYEVNYEDLFCRMLYNWVLYNLDLRFIFLEFFLMKFCVDIDVMIFGFGLMVEDGGFWFGLDDFDIFIFGQLKKDFEGMFVFFS